MEYSTRPEEHELQKARSRIEEVTGSYGYAFEVDEVEFYMGWQKLEKGASFFYGGEKTVELVIDPERDWEEGLEDAILRGLSHVEFMALSPMDEVTFNWQEVLRFAYTRMKMAELAGEENPGHQELEERWSELREQLSNRVDTDEFSEFFYRNAGTLGGVIGEKLLEDHELDELPSLKRSDIVEAGDGIFRE